MTWKEKLERAYYGLGLAYYLYHWILIFGITTGITAVVVSVVFHFSLLFAVALSAVALLGIGTAATLIIRRRQQRRDAVNQLLDIVQSVDSYTIPNSGVYEFKRILTICARHDGVQFFQCKYKWSADGEIRLDVTPPEFVLLAHQFKTDDTLDIAIVRFPRPLRKGEEESFTIIWTMNKSGAPPRPFLSKVIDDFYPNGLTMTVNLPCVPKSSRKDIIRARRSDISTKTILPEQDGHSLSIVWPVRYPRFDAKYKITWTL